jgi:hypothetical protein
LGVFQIPPDETEQAVATALEVGYQRHPSRRSVHHHEAVDPGSGRVERPGRVRTVTRTAWAGACQPVPDPPAPRPTTTAPGARCKSSSPRVSLAPSASRTSTLIGSRTSSGSGRCHSRSSLAGGTSSAHTEAHGKHHPVREER